MPIYIYGGYVDIRSPEMNDGIMVPTHSHYELGVYSIFEGGGSHSHLTKRLTILLLIMY